MSAPPAAVPVFNFQTLLYYGLAGLLSLFLSGLLIAFAHLQEGARIARNVALAILALATAFLLSAFATELPLWATRLGSNLILLAAGVILHTGFTALFRRQPPAFDRFGWLVVGLCAVPFAYWGFIQPDGNLRTATFSFAVVAICSRTAHLLLTTAKQQHPNRPLWLLTGLFMLLVLWMTVRGTLAVFAEPADSATRGANPTEWASVLGFTVLICLLTATTLWLEIHRRRADPRSNLPAIALQNPRDKLFLLWGGVAALHLGLVGAIGFAVSNLHASEQARLIRMATLANDAFTAYAEQVNHQVDTALNAARGYYRRSRSLPDTERFIATLGFDRGIIDNLYLIDSDGKVLTNRRPGAPVMDSDRDYFAFHRDQTEDKPYFSRVEVGRVTGRPHFRISRRLDNPDGSFGGIVLATLRPEAFAGLFDSLLGDADAVIGLIGNQDKLLRARWPIPENEWWTRTIESPLWDQLARTPTGSYQNVSRVDGVRRNFVYRQLDNLPLVMTTGISETELIRGMIRQMRWPAVAAGGVILVIVILAVMLTIEIRRRDEQERFMSMLNHELKTPLSVIRMSLSKDTMSPDIRERVIRSLNDMNAIVERALQADRLQHGRITNESASCQPVALLKQIIDASSQPRRVQLEADRQAELRTDPQLLGVILANLIDNALKYSAPDSKIHVSVSESASRLCIEVSNQAGSAGMPDPRQVFRKYYRAPGAHGKTGSGLGLHIAAGFAARLGGQLRYMPEGGRVKFVLWIPL